MRSATGVRSQSAARLRRTVSSRRAAAVRPTAAGATYRTYHSPADSSAASSADSPGRPEDGKRQHLGRRDVLPLQQPQEASVELGRAEVRQASRRRRGNVHRHHEPHRLRAEPHRAREVERGPIVVEAVDELELVRQPGSGRRDGRVDREAAVDLQHLPAGDVRPHVEVVRAGRECEAQEAQHRRALGIQVGREREAAVVAHDGAFEDLHEALVPARRRSR